MVALLLAVALVVLTVLTLLLAGVVVAVCTGVGLLNALVLALGLRSRRATHAPAAGERWQPRSFRRPPAAPLEPEAEERLQSHPHSLTVRRR